MSARKLEDDIHWHRTQIARLHEAIARGEPGKAETKGPSWGPKGPSNQLPSTMSGLRIQLERFERTLQELEEQRGRGD
jgi:hypothetical protein